MNNQLIRAVLADGANWEFVTFDSERKAPAGFTQTTLAW